MSDSILRTLDLAEVRQIVEEQGADLLRRAGADSVVLARLGRREIKE